MSLRISLNLRGGRQQEIVIHMSKVAHRLVAAAAILVASSSHAASAWDELVANSPFGGSPGEGASTREEGLEFRGVVVEPEGPVFCLHEPTKNTFRWVGLGTSGNAYTVLGYDEQEGLVTVNYQGRTLRLALKRANVALAAMLPAGEKVDESVAVEIARRRAARLARLAARADEADGKE